MNQLVDEKDRTHYLTNKFGEDGQGILYCTKNDTVIVRDSRGRESDRYLFDDVKLLPLSTMENIILPSCCLKEPDIGYTLNIPDGFVPLKTIMTAEKGNEKEFYIKTGGLKRRLSILMNLAKILIELHSMPVMYGSMSADRILISKSNANSEVYLLYSVKMSYIMNFKDDDDTDPYVAPEIQDGIGGTLLSDNYTFAAMALDVLTLCGAHPILTDEMQVLFNQALEQPEPSKRPKISEFYALFAKIYDLILVCKKCQADISLGDTKCPNCSAPLPKMLKAVIYDKISKTRIDKGVKILELVTTRQSFWNYHTENTLLSDTPKPTIDCVLNISNDKKLHLIFKNLMDNVITINSKNIPTGQCFISAIPFEKINITIKLHTSTERCIDVVML